jgi:hypothetical protein
MGIQIAGFTVANLAEIEASTANAGIAVPAPRALRVMLYDANGARVPVGYDQNSAADRETFGAAVVGHRATEVTVDWTQAAAVNAVGVTVSGGGSSAQANGQFQLISGAAVTAAALAQSVQKARYQPGREIYATFTAAFTTPTSASSNQRAGIYDTNNGFWVGYEGVGFGITKRNLKVNVNTPQAAFNVDTLLGATGSQFTSGGAPVALDPTKLNVYRIRYGWLGGATITFQVMAPDGNWVTFHRILAPNTSSTPSIANPTLPLTFEVNKTAADATSLVLSTSSWDAGIVGSNSAVSQSAVSPSGSVAGTPILGLDGGQIIRTVRVGEHGTQRTTSEILLWHDAFEGATINGFWVQSLTTMTVAQATGVLTLNNGAITTLNTDAILTSQRQFPKYPRQPLYCRFRALLTANVAANHTLAEMGLGAPVGVTAVVANGAFFRWTAAGNLVGVVSYNGTETVSPTLIAQGQSSFSTASYYYYDIILDDDFARFIVADSNGIPLVDTQVSIALASAMTTAVSHLPSFARVYVDAVGGGTAVQLKLSAHTVQLDDAAVNKSWDEQLSAAMRHASINPTTYAQTGSSMTAAAATETPSNTAGVYNVLGGDFAVALTATAAEAPLSVFGFQIPSPYTFYLLGLIFSDLFVTTAIAVTGIPILEWFIIANCATGNISTGGGQRFPIGLNHLYSSATQAAGLFVATQGNRVWTPKVPVTCLPGTFLHIGYKVFVTSAAGTPGVTRGSVFVDGKFE